MPIAISCPSCSTSFQVPDSAAGTRGKCRACGEVVAVPSKPAKICSSCGINVSQQPRTKDGAGNYFCNPCWTAHQDAAQTPSHDPATDADELLACPLCGGEFNIRDMDMSGVCTLCAVQNATIHAATSRVRSTASFSKSSVGAAICIILPLVLIGLVGGGWILWKSRATDETQASAALLKGKADAGSRGREEKAAADRKHLRALLLHFAESRSQSDLAFASARELLDRSHRTADRGTAAANLKQAQENNERAKLLLQDQMRLVDEIEPFGDTAFNEVKMILIKDSSTDATLKTVLVTLSLHDSTAFKALKTPSSPSNDDRATGNALLRRAALMIAPGQSDQSIAQGLEMLSQASAEGSADAAFQIGLFHWNRGGADVDAVKWFDIAAARKHPEAVYNLGVAHMSGRGMGASDAEALQCFRRAANLNVPLAMNNLGVFYATGRGVTRDDTEAATWYRKAADGGSEMGMYNLAWCYNRGLGVEMNEDSAMEWFGRAAKAGHPTAAQVAKELKTTNAVTGILAHFITLTEQSIRLEAQAMRIDKKFDQAAARGDLASSERLQAQFKDLGDQVIVLNRQAVEVAETLRLYDKAVVLPVLDIMIADSEWSDDARKQCVRLRNDVSSSRSVGASHSATDAPVAVRCPTCNGTGLLPLAERKRLTSAAMAAAAGIGGSSKTDIKCRTCGGTGVVESR